MLEKGQKKKKPSQPTPISKITRKREKPVEIRLQTPNRSFAGDNQTRRNQTNNAGNIKTNGHRPNQQPQGSDSTSTKLLPKQTRFSGSHLRHLRQPHMSPNTTDQAGQTPQPTTIYPQSRFVGMKPIFQTAVEQITKKKKKGISLTPPPPHTNFCVFCRHPSIVQNLSLWCIELSFRFKYPYNR
jgi:hypothetical protein